MMRTSLATAAALLSLAVPALAQAPNAPTATPGQVIPGQGVVLAPGAPIPPGMVQTGTVTVPPPGTTPAQTHGNTRLGQLSCDVSGGVSYVFGSTRSLSCEFRPINAPVERYTGEIRRFGIDIGYNGRGTFLWDVLNTGSDAQRGSLEGTYAGASSNVALGLGLGSAALIGGSRDQVALQPLAIESSTGVNIAAGISELVLKSGG